MMLLKVLLVCLASKISSAKQDGAPSQSCGFMLPGHVLGSGEHGSPIQHQPRENSRYALNAVWDEDYGYVRLTITGSELKGFLIQARQSENGTAVGSFNIDELSNETKYQNCTGNDHKFNPKASITHGDPSLKKNLTFLWEPPKARNGSVTFYATIVKNFEKFWLKLPSNAIDLLENPITSIPTLEKTSTPKNSSSAQLFNLQVTYSITVSMLLTSLFGPLNYLL